jgi:serine/threonine protein kinase
MVAHPPPNYTEFIGGGHHYNLAWPLDILRSDQGQFQGFLMPKIQNSYPIFHLFYLKEREKIYEKASIQFSYKFLLRVASNLAEVIANLHSAGYVVGDINEQNILFNKDALITIIDVDSFQVTTSDGQFWPCPVGKFEYTHPEILKLLRSEKASFRDIRRQPAHDVFGMAVIIFRLLMEGCHPFQGVLPDEPRPLEEMIEKGIFVYAKAVKSAHQVQPPPSSPNYSYIYDDLGRLFHRTFVKGYEDITQTPSAKLFAIALLYYEKSLVTCPSNPNHQYYQRPDEEKAVCPFCAYKKRLRRDLFPLHKPISRPSLNSSTPLSPKEPPLRLHMLFDLYRAPYPLLEELNEALQSFFDSVYQDTKVRSHLQLALIGIGGKRINLRELAPITKPIPPLLLNTDYEPDLMSSLYGTVREAMKLCRNDLQSKRPFYSPWIVLYLSSDKVSSSIPATPNDEVSLIEEAIKKKWIILMPFALYQANISELFGKQVIGIKQNHIRQAFSWLLDAVRQRLSEPNPKKEVKLPRMGLWRSL